MTVIAFAYLYHMACCVGPSGLFLKAASSIKCLCGALLVMVQQVSDDDGNLYKFKASAEKVDNVLLMVSDKLKMPKDAILLKYQDDDGDEIVLSG